MPHLQVSFCGASARLLSTLVRTAINARCACDQTSVYLSHPEKPHTAGSGQSDAYGHTPSWSISLIQTRIFPADPTPPDFEPNSITLWRYGYSVRSAGGRCAN